MTDRKDAAAQFAAEILIGALKGNKDAQAEAEGLQSEAMLAAGQIMVEQAKLNAGLPRQVEDPRPILAQTMLPGAGRVVFERDIAGVVVHDQERNRTLGIISGIDGSQGQPGILSAGLDAALAYSDLAGRAPGEVPPLGFVDAEAMHYGPPDSGDTCDQDDDEDDEDFDEDDDDGDDDDDTASPSDNDDLPPPPPAPFNVFWRVVALMDWPLDYDNERCGDALCRWLSERDLAVNPTPSTPQAEELASIIERLNFGSFNATYCELVKTVEKRIISALDQDPSILLGPRPGPYRHDYLSDDSLHYLAGCIIGHGERAFIDVMADVRNITKYPRQEGFDYVFNDPDADDGEPRFDYATFNLPKETDEFNPEQEVRLIQKILHNIQQNIESLAELQHEEWLSRLQESRIKRMKKERLRIKIRRWTNLAKRKIKSFFGLSW